LSQHGLQVAIEHLALAEMDAYLVQDSPVVAGVHTGPLSYWSQAVDHVVLVVGVQTNHVYVHDPSLSDGPQEIPRVEFELAQLDFDNLCAVIS
jgi:predicted double-glycine peptidase